MSERPGDLTHPPALEKRAERPHPLSPLIRGWVVLLVILIAIARDLVPDLQRNQFDLIDLILANVLLVILGLLGVVLLTALASFLTWWFTRYVIDDEELRIETGLFTKTSKRIPFRRIQSIDVMQPLAARIFGLAELRIDAGSDKTALRYLSRRKAYRIRDYLLSRAHGEQLSVADSDARTQADAFRDLSADDQVLVTIPPQRLLLGFLTSTDFLVSAALSLVAVVVFFRLGLGVFSFGALIPIVLGTLRMIGSRLLTQFNYTLARTGRGLRIARGLTNLTSQSVPVDRIQGVRITQHLLWKPLGLYRVDIDVLGIAGGETSQVSSILLPVGNARDLAIALAAVLPGVDLARVPLWRSPGRARWLHPIALPTYRFGHDALVAVARRGLIDTVTSVVPHGKVQSVRIGQGPLQRLARVASVHLDTTPGPVTFVAADIDPGDARAFALSQLGRSERARAAVGPLGAVPAPVRRPGR